VWIAGLAQLRPEHEVLLDATEQARADTYTRAADRSRFVLGAALLKLAVANANGVTGRAAAGVVVDRECDQCGRPHGRPRVPCSDIHVSVAHSGDVVTIALTSLAPVGIDVEQRTGSPDPALVTRVLAPTERLDAEPWFLAYWCRKESVLKATGAGLRVPMTEVVVTAPDRSPGLLSYQGDVLPATMFDLDVGDPGYAGALTVLTAQPVQLRVDPADRLLAV
jgi:4'-phosphopantetheinyl transferase